MPRSDLISRARLGALSDPTPYPPHPEPEEREPAPEPNPIRPPGSIIGGAEPVRVVSARAGRLARRWVPESLRHARWEPARSGALAMCAVAAAAALIAAVGVWRDRPVAEPVPQLPALITEAPVEPPGTAAASGELVIDVAGRVARPGLVRVSDGARVADALTAAGGVLPDTDLAGLNLARRVGDGEQLLVGVPPPHGTGAAVTPGAPAEPAAGSRIDLNTASTTDLDTLPGVGPVTAQRIVEWRKANGRFRSVDQLREIEGIGESRFAKLRDLVRV